jgi:hypothetical protein
MRCGCNLRPLQQNIHNTLFSRIVSTKLNIDTTSRIRILLEKVPFKWQTFPAHYKAHTVNRVWSTLWCVRWIQSIISFRSFTLRSPSRPLPWAFCYSSRVSYMHATRPDNQLHWLVRPGNIWWRADKREASRCLCILLSPSDFHVRYVSLIIFSDTRHEVLPTTCGECR